MLLPCSYAFVSTLFPREYVKTPFRLYHFEGSFKNSSRCSLSPSYLITISSILLIILLANSGETLEIAC